jgi:hypothetical protein
MAWPAIGRRVLTLMRDVLDHRVAAPKLPLAPAETARREPKLEEEPQEEPTPTG